MPPTARARAALAGIVACLALLTGCTAAAGSEDPSDVSEIRMAVPVLPTSLDYEASFEAAVVSYTVRDNIHAGLLRYPYRPNPADPGMQVQDYTSYEGLLADPVRPFTRSGNSYVFHLRHGVLSQSGNELTSEDVRWSFERKCRAVPGSVCFSSLNPYFTSPDQVRVVDRYTVAFDLTRIDAGSTFLQMIASSIGFIYDKKALLDHATPDDPWATKWAVMHSGWGFGAYSIESITPDQQMVLVANPNYVLGLPAVRRVSLQVVESAGARAQLLLANNVDIAESLTAEEQTALQSRDGVLLPTVQNPIEFAYLVLLQNKAPFDNPLVRQAFRYAIPYDALIDQNYGGRAHPANGLLTANMGIRGLSEAPAYVTDVARSRELLARAGVDHVRFTMTVSSANPELVNAAILIASEAEKAGFTMDIVQRSAGDFASGRVGQEYQAFLATNRSQVQHPYHITNTFFNPDNTNNNQSDFRGDPAFDRLVARAIAAGDVTDPAAGPYWQRVQDYLDTMAAALPMVYTQPLQAYSSRLRGFTYRYDNTVDFAALRAR